MRRASLERWRRSFDLMSKRVDDEQWRHDLAKSLRDAIGCSFVAVHGDTVRGQQSTWPFDWHTFMTGLRERFLLRIEAVGEGASYAIARFGRVYAPLEVGRDAALLAEGCSNLNVSAHLDISEQTVAVHVRAIYRKLGVHSRVELARRWLGDR